MTDEEATAIAARAAAATPGPWEQPAYPSGTMVYRLAERDHIADCEWATDADFIAHARQDIPALLAERAALVAIAQAVTARFHEYGQCPLCAGTLAHTADCPITRYRQSVDE